MGEVLSTFWLMGGAGSVPASALPASRSLCLFSFFTRSFLLGSLEALTGGGSLGALTGGGSLEALMGGGSLEALVGGGSLGALTGGGSLGALTGGGSLGDFEGGGALGALEGGEVWSAVLCLELFTFFLRGASVSLDMADLPLWWEEPRFVLGGKSAEEYAIRNVK